MGSLVYAGEASDGALIYILGRGRESAIVQRLLTYSPHLIASEGQCKVIAKPVRTKCDYILWLTSMMARIKPLNALSFWLSAMVVVQSYKSIEGSVETGLSGISE